MRGFYLVLVLAGLCVSGCSLSLDAEKLGLKAKTANKAARVEQPKVANLRGDFVLHKVYV